MRLKRIAASVLATAIAVISISLNFAGNTAFAVEASAQSDSSALTVLPTDVDTVSDNNVFIGIEGEYICEIQAALDLINSYRKEACEEGVTNPSTNKPLTTNDYVPIKWSSDLEYIARIRAAEASLTMNHARLTDKSIWFKSPNGISSTGEVLAWNWGRTMTQGIKQWYEEKYDWVNNTGNVTGHYTQMIDPCNLYVGLATFFNQHTTYPNTTAGEFSGRSGLDETKGQSTGEIIQKLEASKSYLSNLAVTENGSRFSLTATVKVTDYWGGTTTSKGIEILSGVEWTSSDTNVVAVDSFGNITKKSNGSATVSASFDGEIYEMTFNGSKVMYRLYNPNSGEHFYTSNAGEKDNLVSLGWNYEGIGWYAPLESSTPVYRLYNKNGGEHHYTASVTERDRLVKLGWNYEGIGWNSDDAQGVPIYRQYNPNAFANNHNYTASKTENDRLVSYGWRYEGVGWYGVA